MSGGAGQESRRPLEGPSGAEEASTRVITTVFVALLIDLLGFTLILPLLPSILDHYSKNDDGLYMTLQRGVNRFAAVVGVPPERKYNSVLFGGLIGSIFSILQFFASPLTGAASDYFGRRPVMLLTVMGLVASYSLWAVSRTFELFLLSRVIGGISKGNVSLSTAIIADLACPRARSKGMAMIGVAFSLGFTVGPMLGAYLAMETEKGEIFYVWSALFAVMFAVTDLAFIFFLLPETLPKEKRVSSVSSGFQSVIRLLSPWALFQFAAVSHRMDPPSRKSKSSSFQCYIMNPFEYPHILLLLHAQACNQCKLFPGDIGLATWLLPFLGPYYKQLGAKSCPTHRDPMDNDPPGLPVLYHSPESI